MDRQMPALWKAGLTNAGLLWDPSLATIIPRWAKLSEHHPQTCPWTTHTPKRCKFAITWFWVAIACNRNEHKLQIAVIPLWHSGALTAAEFRSALLAHSNSWALCSLRNLWIHLSCGRMEEVFSPPAPWWCHGQISASQECFGANLWIKNHCPAWVVFQSLASCLFQF